ncbi:30S ribosomal protein S20 [Patescibacteria group bacterium]|nr:30S ribosomal protein S20 [Patescibacteria group bacterium]
MPITKSARKALRRDRRRTQVNKPIRTRMMRLLRTAFDEPSGQNIAAAFSGIDRATKKRIFHQNRAARLKSRLMKATRRTK